jgi:hypothetical protein
MRRWQHVRIPRHLRLPAKAGGTEAGGPSCQCGEAFATLVKSTWPARRSRAKRGTYRAKTAPPMKATYIRKCLHVPHTHPTLRELGVRMMPRHCRNNIAVISRRPTARYCIIGTTNRRTLLKYRRPIGQPQNGSRARRCAAV